MRVLGICGSRAALTLVLLAAPLALSVASCKDDEPEAEESASEGEKGEEPEGEAAAAADDEKAAAKGDEEAGSESAASARKRRLEALRKAREARRKAREAGDETGEAKAADGEGVDEDLTPAEKRRREREKRIAELRKRSEERRKQREAARTAGGDGADRDEEADRTDGDSEAHTPTPRANVERAATPGARRPEPRAATPRHRASGGAVLSVSNLLTVADIEKTTGKKKLEREGELVGIDQSPGYGSAYFAAKKSKGFGVSLQVWREPTRRELNEHFRRMQRDYPNAEDTAAITPKGFFSYWNDIMTLTFMDFGKRTIVSVSCGQSVCTPEQLFGLAMAVKERI